MLCIVHCSRIEYSRFEAKIREIREQMLQTSTGNGGGGIQSQQQTGRFVRFLLIICFSLTVDY